MKIKNLYQKDEFEKAIDKCKGNVYLMDDKGSKLDLKSLFSRYISMGKLLDKEGDKLELFCDCKDDERHFMKFFYENPEVLAPMVDEQGTGTKAMLLS
ncbi:MAG: polya polymerase [Acutalibacteraceae bacterium]|nr:polya polymerase [Acutalibacteraceae bacterium]